MSIPEAKKPDLDHPVHDLVARRWSPYAFADRAVEVEDLRAVFEAARWAASSYNEQPWRWIVARREEPAAHARLLSCLVEANRVWAQRAPVLGLGIFVRDFARNGEPNRAAQHDLGLAAGNLTTEATARGLAVHQMIGILPDRARDLYRIPEAAEALTGLAIGYAGSPDELDERLRDRDRAARSRRPLAESVFSGVFGRPADFLEPEGAP